MRDRNAHETPDGGKCQRMTTERIGMVDLIIAIAAAKVDACITRDRQHRYARMLLIDGSEHQCVTAADIALPAVNPHEDDIAQLMLRPLLERISTPKRPGHKIMRTIINGAYQ